ncbi:MAG: hypothetical protein MZU95_06435 [Desulfomicrobium escambiense]|nr:hypothetical protein [Desulfomicrobium escambiense]
MLCYCGGGGFGVRSCARWCSTASAIEGIGLTFYDLQGIHGTFTHAR